MTTTNQYINEQLNRARSLIDQNSSDAAKEIISRLIIDLQAELPVGKKLGA